MGLSDLGFEWSTDVVARLVIVAFIEASIVARSSIATLIVVVQESFLQFDQDRIRDQTVAIVREFIKQW
jgi:hypothetical protein